MNGSAAGSWSVSLGRWGGVEVRLHLHFPLLVLAAMLAVQWSARFRVTDRFNDGGVGGLGELTSWGVASGLFVLLASVILHEIGRLVVSRRVGGRTTLIVLGPTGGWSQPALPADPPAHLVTALVGPVIYLSLAVSAACILALHGQNDVLPLLSLTPQFEPNVTPVHYLAQLTVWINFWLLLVNLLPIYPCDGAELLRGMLWPLVGRPSAAAALAHIAFGAAAATLVLAIILRDNWIAFGAPAWFPLALLSVLLIYGGNRSSRQRQYDVGLAIDEFDSDDEQWLAADWLEEDRAVVLVEHLQEKQQEALDRKKRERESQEDAQVDDILARLNETSFDQLSEEEQAILKRAARRYRARRKGC